MAVMKLRKGSERKFDVELPVEAYIAVASKLVTYLVLGAVWMQLVQIEVTLPSSGGGGGGGDAGLSLTLLVSEKQIDIAATGGSLPPIQNLPNGDYDLNALSETLKKIREKFADHREIVLAIQSTVVYDRIVGLMDECIKNNFDAISFAPYTPPDAAAPPK
ncbi:MAG: biopolymer transporter ExbD [Bdellovibrionota bacterium]